MVKRIIATAIYRWQENSRGMVLHVAADFSSGREGALRKPPVTEKSSGVSTIGLHLPIAFVRDASIVAVPEIANAVSSILVHPGVIESTIDMIWARPGNERTGLTGGCALMHEQIWDSDLLAMTPGSGCSGRSGQCHSCGHGSGKDVDLLHADLPVMIGTS